MKTKKKKAILGKLDSVILKGLIAGLAGTAAITLSQTIEMKLTKRKPSDAPAEAVEKALDITSAEDDKKDFSQKIHWVYGTTWGIMRGLLSLVGIRGFAATTLHTAAVWGTAVNMEPKLGIAPPIQEWETKDIAVDVFHHCVYAIVAGLVYDALD